MRPWVEALRNVGFAVFAKPKTSDDSDVDDMLDLVERTRPGPFRRHTIDLGTYLGIRRDGKLIATIEQMPAMIAQVVWSCGGWALPGRPADT